MRQKRREKERVDEKYKNFCAKFRTILQNLILKSVFDSSWCVENSIPTQYSSKRRFIIVTILYFLGYSRLTKTSVFQTFDVAKNETSI